MDEEKLIKKLRSIEALFSGATTTGERVAADRARQRILDRLREMERVDPPVEYRFTMSDVWAKRVFLALCRRYGLEPYRYRGQRRTTVMLRVSRGFVDQTLWPEFKQLSETLRVYLAEVTDRVVAEVIHEDASEAREVARGQLPLPRTEETAQRRADDSTPAISAVGADRTTGGQAATERGNRAARRANKGKRQKGKRR